MDQPASIFISSVNSTAGITVVRTLRQAIASKILPPMDIIGLDNNPLGAGFRFVDHKVVIEPRSSINPSVDCLRNLADISENKILIPAHSNDVRLLSQHAHKLSAMGYSFLISSASAIEMCESKIKFSEYCSNLNVDTPRICSLGTANNFPLFVKPNRGSGSKQTQMVSDQQELEEVVKTINDPLVQEYIPGPEVTVDLFSSREGTIYYSARTRDQVHNGQSVSGTTCDSRPFKKILEKIITNLGLLGPLNAQFILHPERGPVLIEINPRFAAGGLALTIAAGLNIPVLLVKDLLKQRLELPQAQYELGLKMSRYYTETFWRDHS
jgi:carbamoyl-phosphate synthase large subunit